MGDPTCVNCGGCGCSCCGGSCPPPDVPPDMATCGGGPPSGYSASPSDPSGYSGSCNPSYSDPVGNPNYSYDPYKIPTPEAKSEEDLAAEAAERKTRLDEILARLYDYSLDHSRESHEELKKLLEGYGELTGKYKPGFMI